MLNLVRPILKLIEIRQAIEMTGISNNILTQTVDAFGLIISNNLSVVVKLLTSMTIILMIPMLVTSIYGMNVDLPFDELQHSFWIVMGVALSAAGSRSTSSGSATGLTLCKVLNRQRARLVTLYD
jgi:Mg2+ and Co2+ transporter CorA